MAGESSPNPKGPNAHVSQWLAIIALALVAVVAALWPLLRRPRDGVPGGTDGGTGERAVLRAALAENEADRTAGRIGDEDAAAARAELGRRLLRLQREGEGERATSIVRPIVPVLTALLVPLGAFALYGAVGSPGTRDLPVSARVGEPVRAEDARQLLARAEAHLAANPDDARGWAVIAPIYRRMGEDARAADAFERGLPALEGADRAHALTELAEIVIMRDGTVDAEARDRLVEALRLDPANGRAGFYLAAHAEESGGRDAGLAAWRALVERHRLARPGWLPAAERRIAMLEAVEPGALPASVSPPRGPGRADVEAAAAMSEDDRSALIEDMVAGLAARLEAEPDDADGWARLVRSLIVLDRREDAVAALARADEALGEGGAAYLAPLRAELGVDGSDG